MTVSFDRFLNVAGSLTYQNLGASAGAVDVEWGHAWCIAVSGRFVRDKVFKRARVGLSRGWSLPWAHSSLWLRTDLGFSPDDRKEPLANFYFGAFGNNWVDRLAVKRFGEYYSLPGVELDAVGATSFWRNQLEWSLPPLRCV